MIKLKLLIVFIGVLSLVSGESCSIDDDNNRCVWDLLKLIGLQNQFPNNLRMALRNAVARGILTGKCQTSDVPSTELINMFEKASENGVIPKCVVKILRAIKPCDRPDDEVTRPITLWSSTMRPTIPGSITTRPITTRSVTTKPTLQTQTFQSQEMTTPGTLTTMTDPPRTTATSNSSSEGTTAPGTSTPDASASETIASKSPSSDASTPETSLPPTNPPTTIFDPSKYALPGFGGSISKETRINYTEPSYMPIIFRNRFGSSDSRRGRIYNSLDQMITRLATDQDIENFLPDYIVSGDDKVLACYNHMRELYVTGQEGDWDFVLHPVIKTLVEHFVNQGVTVPWIVVDRLKFIYAAFYNGPYTESSQIRSNIEWLNMKGWITQEQVDLYSNTFVVDTIMNGFVADKQDNAVEFRGVNDDLLNPLFAERAAAGLSKTPADALKASYSLIISKYNSNQYMTDYVPETLRSDLEKELSPEDVERYMQVYVRMRERFITKFGTIKNANAATTVPGVTRALEIYYFPDERLKPVYDGLLEQGKMTESVFNTLKKWTSAIVTYVENNPTAEGYDNFYPNSFNKDLQAIVQAEEDDQIYRQAYVDLRALIKTFMVEI